MIENKMKLPINSDSRGVTAVVDEAIDGTKAIPMVLVTKNVDGLFEYASSGGEGTPGPKGETGDTGLTGATGAKGDTGAAGFGTKAQYDAIIARLDALEITP